MIDRHFNRVAMDWLMCAELPSEAGEDSEKYVGLLQMSLYNFNSYDFHGSEGLWNLCNIWPCNAIISAGACHGEHFLRFGCHLFCGHFLFPI